MCPAARNSPLHMGGGAVHTPEAVHCTSSGPTKTDPSSQLKLQLDWLGCMSIVCRQRMLPRSGGRRGGHGVAENKHRLRVSTWEAEDTAATRYLPKGTGRAMGLVAPVVFLLAVWKDPSTLIFHLLF